MWTNPKPDHLIAREQYADRSIAAANACGDKTLRAMDTLEMQTRMARILLK